MNGICHNQPVLCERPPNSFIKHVWDAVMPWTITPRAADILTFAAFFTAVVITIYLNFIKKTPDEGQTAPTPAAD